MNAKARATQRVFNSPSLRNHHYILLDFKWPEGDLHYQWVATAEEKELLEWVASAERVFLHSVQKV